MHDRLDDLVREASRLANKHVMDLDRDAPPKDSEQSAMEYFEQIAFVASEINAIKSLWKRYIFYFFYYLEQRRGQHPIDIP